MNWIEWGSCRYLINLIFWLNNTCRILQNNESSKMIKIGCGTHAFGWCVRNSVYLLPVSYLDPWMGAVEIVFLYPFFFSSNTTIWTQLRIQPCTYTWDPRIKCVWDLSVCDGLCPDGYVPSIFALSICFPIYNFQSHDNIFFKNDLSTCWICNFSIFSCEYFSKILLCVMCSLKFTYSAKIL